MLTGNKGEWSEAYVFLRILGDGVIYAADDKLEKLEKVFFPIIQVLREEGDRKRNYAVNGDISVVDGETGDLLMRVKKSDFLTAAKKLLERLKKVKGRSFSCPEIEKFLSSVDAYCITPSKTTKADVKVMVHDLRTAKKPILGFSIKSMLGGNATLFNPGGGTNFIYEITGAGRLDLNAINKITDEPKIASRINFLYNNGFKLKFTEVQSENLRNNLVLIDSNLPEIIAYMLLYKYSGNNSPKLSDLLEILKVKNPLNFPNESKHPFYSYKIKHFLTDAALGMTPNHVWEGEYDATGGIIIVRKDGEIVCYHIYNQNEFQEYLVKNTRLEQASTTRYNFGDIYEQNGKHYIKLNLQIRFI